MPGRDKWRHPMLTGDSGIQVERTGGEVYVACYPHLTKHVHELLEVAAQIHYSERGYE